MSSRAEAIPLLDGTEENELVRMAKNGNKDAFGELMVRWRPYIITSLNKAMSEQRDVEDAYQETAMSLLVSIKSVKLDNWRGWIRSVIKYRRYTFLRNIKARGDRLKTGENIHDAIIGQIESRDDDSALICQKLETQRKVREAIDNLPEKQKETIQDIFFNGETAGEVARKAKVTKAAIYRRVHNAKHVLRDSLSQYEYQKETIS